MRPQLLATLRLIACLPLLSTSVMAQQPQPTLHYDPPGRWYRSAAINPVQYSAHDVNAGVQVYPFRPIGGTIEPLMQHDLLRSWIDPQFRESNVAAPPLWGRDYIPGADAVYSIHFVESVAGAIHEHLRLVIVSGEFAAIVDASAATQESWRLAGPALEAMHRSLRVETAIPAPAPRPGPGPAGKEIAGLYMGSRLRYMADLQGGSTSGRTVAALHFYLFSAEGAVYRFYDVPAGDLARFDFAAAARTDPENSGWFAVTRGALTIHLDGPQAEVITTRVPQAGRLVVDGIVYQRQ